MADLFTTIDERGSIRAYTGEGLTEQEIKTLVGAGLKAPTARNEQELHFSVIDAKSEVMKEIQQELNPNATTNFYYDAPLFISISGQDSFGWSAVDAGIAVENIHLAAKGMGLGSVIIGCVKGVLTGEKKAYYDEKMGVPEGYSYLIAIAIGHPDTTKEPHTFDAEKNVSYIK